MNLGIALGGAAEGFAKGVKLADQLEENKLARETRTREREARALDDAIVMPGDTMPSTRAAPAPVQDKGILGALIARLKPHEAVRAAGLPAMGIPGSPETLAAHAAPAPTAGINTAAPAAATEDATVAEITVRPPRPAVATETDTLRQMMAAAAKRGDRETQAKLWPHLMQAQTNDKLTDLAIAKRRGIAGFANYASEFLGQDVSYDDVEGKPGYYKVNIDGEDIPGERTLGDLVIEAAGEITRNPMLALDASLKLSQERRLDRTAATNELLARTRAQVDQISAVSEAERRQVQNNKDIVETEEGRIKLKQLKDEDDAKSTYTQLLAEDALTNAPQLDALTRDPRFARYNYTATTTDEQGVRSTVTKNHMADQLLLEAQARKQQYLNSPYTKSGVIQLNMNTPQGPLYLVKGLNGGFKSFDDAELEARRIERAAKKAPIPARK